MAVQPDTYQCTRDRNGNTGLLGEVVENDRHRQRWRPAASVGRRVLAYALDVRRSETLDDESEPTPTNRTC